MHIYAVCFKQLAPCTQATNSCGCSTLYSHEVGFKSYEFGNYISIFCYPKGRKYHFVKGYRKIIF